MYMKSSYCRDTLWRRVEIAETFNQQSIILKNFSSYCLKMKFIKQHSIPNHFFSEYVRYDFCSIKCGLRHPLWINEKIYTYCFVSYHHNVAIIATTYVYIRHYFFSIERTYYFIYSCGNNWYNVDSLNTG